MFYRDEIFKPDKILPSKNPRPHISVVTMYPVESVLKPQILKISKNQRILVSFSS
jgi:hypothetical protein